MPVLVVGTEKTFAALRPRLFTGRVAKRDARVVAEAIRAANPNVNLDRLTPGTVLTVPAGVGARMGRELSFDQTVPEAIGALVTQARAALDELVTAAKGRERESSVENRSLAKALGSKEVQVAMRQEPALRKDVEAVRKAIADEEAGAKDRIANLESTRAEWLNDLDALNALLRR